MNNKKIISATLCALTAQIIFGFSFMFTKTALGFGAPMVVIAHRYIVAFALLYLSLIFTHTKIKLSGGVWKLVVMSLFQPVLYFVFETYGIKLTTSTFSSIMISMIPVVSMISGIFFLNESPSFMQYVFSLVSVSGVVIVTLAGSADGTVTFGGVLLLLGAVVSSVGYNIASRKISAEFTAAERTFAMTLIGVVTFVGIAFFGNMQNLKVFWEPFLSLPYLTSVLYLGIFSSVVAFYLMNYANTYLPVAKTTVFANITTVVSVIAGTVFLKEKIYLRTIVAVCMIILGVWGVQLFSVKDRTKNGSVNKQM